MEGRALTGLAVGQDMPVMVFNDLLTHGEADAGAAVFVFAVEAFEDVENLFRMFRLKADTIIPEFYVIVCGSCI